MGGKATLFFANEDVTVQFRVSTATKRLVGRIDEGEDLLEVISAICEENDVAAGQVRAVGQFDQMKLVHFASQRGEYVPVVDGLGQFELVQLHGSVSRLGGEVAVRLDGTVNVGGPAGPQLVGGQLRSARAVQGEFVIDVFADLQMQRRLDGDTGQLVLDEIERRGGAEQMQLVESAPDSGAEGDDGADGTSMSWDEAIQKAEKTEKRRKTRRSSGSKPTARKTKEDHDPYAGFDFDEPELAAGDLIDHPKLGKCRVLDVEDDQYVKIKLPRGRIRKLALSVLEIDYQGSEDDRRVFKARVRR